MNIQEMNQQIKYIEMKDEVIIIRSKLMKAKDFNPINRNSDEL